MHQISKQVILSPKNQGAIHWKQALKGRES